MKISDRRMAAARKGAVKFDAGKVCPRCESRVRYVSTNQCSTCVKARSLAYSRKVRDVVKAAREAMGAEAEQ